MNFIRFAERMEEEPYTESLEYRLAYGGMTSRGREWPQIVSSVDDSVTIVKVPLYNIREDRYVRVTGFMPDAFRGKENITDIIIPRVRNGVIEAGSFAGCKNLKRITIPEVIRIEENAFAGCDSLEDIYF
ncbi:MAG: leucine-rich repeat domain-containing protein [Lachnospiraceae bacterium]|nr:leucine-rich repeat domain-containing protein [Lachnospiraceae bacterium]